MKRKNFSGTKVTFALEELETICSVSASQDQGKSRNLFTVTFVSSFYECNLLSPVQAFGGVMSADLFHPATG